MAWLSVRDCDGAVMIGTSEASKVWVRVQSDVDAF
jgi:hypothetical protein